MTPFKLLHRIQAMSPNKLVMLLFTCFIAGFSTFAWHAWSTINLLELKGPIYKQVLSANDFNADILPPPGFIVESAFIVERLKEVRSSEEFASLYTQLEELRRQYDQSVNRWKDELTNDELRQAFIEESQGPARQFYGIVENQLLPAIKAGDRKLANEIVVERLRPLYQAHYESIKQCVQLNADQLAEFKSGSDAKVLEHQQAMMGVLGVAALAVLVLTKVVTSGIKKQESDNILLRQMFQHGDGMVFVDTSGVVRYISPAAAKSLAGNLGSSATAGSQFIGKPIKSLLPTSTEIGQKGWSGDSIISVAGHHFRVTTHQTHDKYGTNTGTLYQLSCVTEEVERKEREARESQDMANRVKQILAVVDAASKGDLTQEIPVTKLDSIGQIAQSLGQFIGTLRGNLRQIAQSVTVLNGASQELSATSQQMNDNAVGCATQVSTASATSSELSMNMDSVSVSIQQLQSAVQEIAHNAAMAATISEEAAQSVDTANSTIQQLSHSSAEIGKVLKLITDIAEKTNLLALNATIEAARAGEAGKGFAVVANEVKELAKATSQATGDISQRILDIQAGAAGAVNVIQSIGGVIKAICDTSSSIAAAVEEQAVTASSLSENVVHASNGTSDIARSLAQVSEATEDASNGSRSCLHAAKELGETADRLQRMVCSYRFNDEKFDQVCALLPKINIPLSSFTPVAN